MEKYNTVYSGINDAANQTTRDLIRYINLKLATIGQPVYNDYTENGTYLCTCGSKDTEFY